MPVEGDHCVLFIGKLGKISVFLTVPRGRLAVAEDLISLSSNLIVFSYVFSSLTGQNDKFFYSWDGQ